VEGKLSPLARATGITCQRLQGECSVWLVVVAQVRLRLLGKLVISYAKPDAAGASGWLAGGCDWYLT